MKCNKLSTTRGFHPCSRLAAHDGPCAHEQIIWAEPHPCSVAQMIAHDGNGRILMMHRSELVRSARNVWGFPTGTHELGEPIRVCATRELREEYGLEVIDHTILGVYENIAGDSDAKGQYHWLLVMIASRVTNLEHAVNREPEKHDQFMVIEATDMLKPTFFEKFPVHPSLTPWMQKNMKLILDTVYSQ